MSAKKLTTLLAVFFFLGLVTEAVAGGFGGFGRMLKRNLKRSARRKVRNTKDKAKERVIGAKTQAVSNLTGGMLTGEDGEAVDFKESLKSKLKEKASAITPLAGADNKEDVKANLSATFRARIEAMRSRISKNALKDSVVSNVTGGQLSASEDEEGGESLSIRDRIRARLEAAKSGYKDKVNTKIHDASGVIDKVGGSSGVLDLNTADSAQLSAVDGISEADANNIIDYREQNGSVEAKDLIDIVGYKKYMILRTQLYAGDGEEDDEEEEEEEY